MTQLNQRPIQKVGCYWAVFGSRRFAQKTLPLRGGTRPPVCQRDSNSSEQKLFLDVLLFPLRLVRDLFQQGGGRSHVLLLHNSQRAQAFHRSQHQNGLGKWKASHHNVARAFRRLTIRRDLQHFHIAGMCDCIRIVRLPGLICLLVTFAMSVAGTGLLAKLLVLCHKI